MVAAQSKNAKERILAIDVGPVRYKRVLSKMREAEQH